MNELKLIFFGSAVLILTFAVPTVRAGYDTRIVMSLDKIMIDLRGEPELLYTVPTALPGIFLRPIKSENKLYPQTPIIYSVSRQELLLKPVTAPNYASISLADDRAKNNGLEDLIKHNAEKVLILPRQIQDTIASSGNEQCANRTFTDVFASQEIQFAILHERASKIATMCENEYTLQQFSPSIGIVNFALHAQYDSASNKTEEIAFHDEELIEFQEKLAEKKRQVDIPLTSINYGILHMNQIDSDQGESVDTIVKLQSKITVLSTQLDQKTEDLGSLRQELAGLNEKLTSTEKMMAALRLQLEERSQLLSKRTPAPVGIVPITNDQIRDYALGALWAHEMLGLIRENQNSDFHIDREQVLSGAADFLHDQLKIPKSNLVAVINNFYTNRENHQKDVSQVAEPTGNDYINEFSKLPGVKRDEIGYFYFIAKQGKGSIKDSSTVAVVIRESLSDGKIINDMLERHSVLSLPLNKFPALFKSAIAKTKNHGEIHIVVPSELAYGEKGRTPDIPPNATMVYDIKVVDVNSKR